MNTAVQPLPSERRRLPAAAAWAIALAMAVAPLASELLRPSERTSDIHGAIDLARQVPTSFGAWREDKSVTPVLPDPAMQATLDATYSQVLARTFINDRGQRVMLSIAYGNDQNSEATAVHRPEFCYRAQGFDIRDTGTSTVALPSSTLTVQRLVGTMGPRLEPISYWITLDETATLPGVGRKLQQIRYGLQGLIADGMVVRVSTVGIPEAASFPLQERFIAELREGMPEALRRRYFGS